MYKEKLQKFAVKDYQGIDEQEASRSHGAFKCWCEMELARDYNYAIAADYGHPDGTAICAEYGYLLTK